MFFFLFLLYDASDKVVDLKVVDALPFQKPSDAPPTTELYQKPTPATTPFFAVNGMKRK